MKAAQIKVAVLGSGGMGRTVIRHLQKMPEPVEIVAYDQSSESLAKAVALGVTGVDSLEQVLGDQAVRLVFVTASNHAHKELTLASLRAGKAVMVEKPIAVNFQDSEEVVREAERLNAFLQVGFELRYSTLYLRAKQWIEAGLLGEVVNFSGTYICSEFHGRGSWRNFRDSGGSMFGEKLSHYVDLQRWWAKSEVREVYAASSPNVVPYFEVNDNYHVICRFQNGAVGHLTFMMAVAESFNGDPLQNAVSQQVDDGHELRYLVVGSKGAFETDVFRRRLRRWEFGDSPKGITSKLAETLTWSEAEDHAWFHNTESQTWDIVRRVREGLPPATPARDALETMRLCEAVQASVDEERTVSLEAEAALS